MVGWKDNRDLLIAGPRPSRPDTQRASSTHAACITDCSPAGLSQRLVTRAFTWDQQASRAFAAELLAPRGPRRSTPERADRAAVEQLAQEFVASSKVIENQLENAGVAIVDD